MNNLYPALLSTPMVQAHKAGRKTETRRLNGLDVINEHETPDCWTFEGFEDEKAKFNSIYPSINPRFVKLPYGNVGDFIYFKESITVYDIIQNSYAYTEGETVKYPPHFLDKKGIKKSIDYKADYPKASVKWKPSIHMPLSAARYFGLITEVRIERLHAITEESAIAEGIEKISIEKISNRYKNYSGKISFKNAKGSYESLWMSLNGEDSWEVNPWVWVYKYEPKTRAEVEAVLGELKTKTQIKKESDKQALFIHNK